MKKIITVLMVLMVATSMFARTKVSDLFPSGGETKTLFKNEIEERVAYADTSYEQLDYEKITTEEIISVIDKPGMEFEEYELTFSKYSIEPLDKYAEKYNVYYVGGYNRNWFRFIVKLNDKEQLEITYKMKTK